ncbi:hypothetical protein SAMN05428949_1987 [Chitinophaga sp. YR627]|uniref:hypothetical protein n=1 Tax=Chitinophaga sp. YR627 TaxID=1881041 RepID=UPI0008E1D217|nr:hypothetical protein [Chitinophaga sp. YR627]SFN21978.1 hypothetical protein SAMN05428949_1987 [Chitinophaga sp. YR627]
MRQAYIDNIERIQKARILDQGEKPYDYSYDHRVDAYDDFFESADFWLQKQALAQGFPPCFIYFRSDDDVNAFAVSKPGFKRIAFTHGMIELIYDYYRQQEDLLNSAEFSDVHQALAQFGNPYWYTFFQLWQMFVIYHEYGHLVQKGKNAEINYREYNSGNVDNILESHALELDADFLAASELARNIMSAACDQNGLLAIDETELSTLCSVALASTFIFFMKVAGQHPSVYFMDKEHPHPYVRLMWVTNILIDTIIKSISGIKLDPKTCTLKALEIADRIMDGDYKNPSQTFSQEMTIHYPDLLNHLTTIVQKMESMSTLCYNLHPDQLPV